MEEKQVILKLLKILNKKEEKPPEKYKEIWKCLICDELFPKKPSATRHIYCVHENYKQKTFKCSELPEHPKLRAIYRPMNPSPEDEADLEFLQEVKTKYQKCSSPVKIK